MNSQAWVSVAAIAATTLVALAGFIFNRSAQARQIEAEKQRSITTVDLEARRAHDQRVWDARATVYIDYLHWLQETVREILRQPESNLLTNKVSDGWWKTPYELRANMALFESDAVRAERGALVKCFIAINSTLDTIDGNAREHPAILDDLRRESGEALTQIDVIIETIRSDMGASTALATPKQT
ncbi:hypothetical protein AB0P21_30350 [Kribbella sp. NPDC056861]|uniref:hypothetical protein n=1 Tax=Kribbella sp. NPDC056861 TaxID=3154857 RepID=UPI003421C26C